MNTIAILFVLHYIGDFPLQGEFLGTMKGKYDYLLFCHVIIWTGIICFGLDYLGIFVWWKAYFLYSIHYLTDRWKARKEDKTYALTKDLWIDQAIHAVQILIVAVL